MIQKRNTSVRIFFSLVLVLTLFSCGNQPAQQQTSFHSVPSSVTTINFKNVLQDTPDFNIIEYLYFFNGGGVAVGDINNDGLPDIYFSSNQQSNKLYLNKGNFKFEDITESSHTAGAGNWKTGVSMADVNADGLLDIFICGVGNYKKFDGRNQLLINNGDLTFTDRTSELGLDFQGFSSQASFFDYDNDGDLDMFLVNHSIHTIRSYGPAAELRYQTDSLAGDKLYRNELIPSGHAVFKEVSKDAGILTSQIGYGLAVGVSDLNRDGYIDIYVSNDFNENDYLYMNNGNGTFSQQLEQSVPHSSRFSMGNDIGDVNNDGLPDIMTLDMLPREEQVIKTTAGEDDYEIYDFKLRYGYHYQFLRNTLQLNRGPDADGKLMFSDIGAFAGVEATDWSWSPLFGDFDNDGRKDLFITAGIVGRPNGLDYINYISHDSIQNLSDAQLIEQMPSGEVPNAFFRNAGNLGFENVSKPWIGTQTGFSTGASYADLDNDGDLDLVVNNINEDAFIYRNDLPGDASNYLKIVFRGQKGNKFGVGASATVYTDQGKQYYEQIPVRGWMSSVDYVMHIGLGHSTKVDSLQIRWPGGKMQTLTSVKSNQKLTVTEGEAQDTDRRSRQASLPGLLKQQGDVPFVHRENRFISFSRERLIPHMLSTQGPHLATADINGDQLDDFFVCGATGQPGAIFRQERRGDFVMLEQPALGEDAGAEDVDAAFFDANGDSFFDLVVVSGGQEYTGKDRNLLPRLYINDGRGGFKKDASALPEIFVNASCVRPADIDNDGDVDLFIGGRVVPGDYGIDPLSYVLINNGRGTFEALPDIEVPVKGKPSSLGMVTDAVWMDINSDSLADLVVVGEWMPVTVLIQDQKGTFANRTEAYGLLETEGWWNTLYAQDFDGDGDRDLLAGNLGLNSRLRATASEPVGLFVSDLDKNNSLDQILTYYNGGKRYPVLSRNQLIKQVPSFRRKFLKYENYKDVKLEEIIEPAAMKAVIQKKVSTFASLYIENGGDGKFKTKILPAEAQIFPIYSFCSADVNGDGKLDILTGGNFYEVQPEFGRYDAGYGLCLLGDGKGNFNPLTPQTSGFVVKGQIRDIKMVETARGRTFLVARNNDSIKAFGTR